MLKEMWFWSIAVVVSILCYGTCFYLLGLPSWLDPAVGLVGILATITLDVKIVKLKFKQYFKRSTTKKEIENA